MLPLLGASAVGALTPSHGFSQAGRQLDSAANRAQIVDADFDLSPYLTQLMSRRM